MVGHVRRLIEQRHLGPGDRLPGERDLARELGVSRPTVRAGLRALAGMGIVEARQGAGTFIRQGPPWLASEPLGLLATLHRVSRGALWEARSLLETGAAALAAERARPEQLARLAEEVAGLFASTHLPAGFLAHDIAFHRTLAEASRNPIVASLVEMVSALYYDQRLQTTAAATGEALRTEAEMHRRIYQAIRAHDPAAAGEAMGDHLTSALGRRALAAASAARDDSRPDPPIR